VAGQAQGLNIRIADLKIQSYVRIVGNAKITGVNWHWSHLGIPIHSIESRALPVHRSMADPSGIALRSSAGPQAEDPTTGTVDGVRGADQPCVGFPWNNNEPRQARDRQQGDPSVLDPGRIPLPSPWQPTALNRTCLAGSRLPIFRLAAGSMSGSVLKATLDDGDDQAVTVLNVKYGSAL